MMRCLAAVLVVTLFTTEVNSAESVMVPSGVTPATPPGWAHYFNPYLGPNPAPRVGFPHPTTHRGWHGVYATGESMKFRDYHREPRHWGPPLGY